MTSAASSSGCRWAATCRARRRTIGCASFVDALDLVGMTAESAALLDGLAATIADDSSFGGIGTGRDWRMWDGTPSGYEGQLVEGFSVLASGLRRFSSGSSASFIGTGESLVSAPVR